MLTKKIAVFVSHIFGEYQTELCQGIIDKATEHGFFVDILCTTDGENLGDYGLGEKSILRIPTLEEYSGVIFASGTYLLQELADDIRATLHSRCHCPIIDITQNKSNFSCVALDNFSAIENLVDHMIHVHNSHNLAYLGCSTEFDYNEKRFNFFKKGLEKHNITLLDSMYAHCDRSEPSISEALEYLLKAENRPEAIICYNDQIALTAMTLLQEMGYNVPNDIALTGCDNLAMGRENTPSLTSVTFPIYTMGVTAVTQLIRCMEGEKAPDFQTVKSSIFYGTSCGCPGSSVPHLKFEHRLLGKIEDTERALIRNIDMSARFQSVNDIDEGVDILEEFVSKLSGCREFYLCLYGDWNHLSNQIRTLTHAEDNELDDHTILLKFGMRDGRRLPECTFSKNSTLPDYIYKNSSHVYVYSPLYFGEKAFGYVALSYEDNLVQYPFTFFSWLMNINSMLKSICDKRNMGLLITRLEDIYTRDDLTGLYNRQGFKLVSENYLSDVEHERISLFVAVFDLDGLKTINDTFGHMEGNFAIQVLGHALENSIAEHDICARLGGDEFYVLGANYTEEDARNLICKVQKYLDHYNRLHTKEYNISASGGYFITSEFILSDLQELFDRADREMYKMKKNKKKEILK